MADFYAILAKALTSRDTLTGEERRKIYERARIALVNQLQSIDPPLPPEEITRQRVSLEEAVRQIESEMDAVAAVAAIYPSQSVNHEIPAKEDSNSLLSRLSSLPPKSPNGSSTISDRGSYGGEKTGTESAERLTKKSPQTSLSAETYSPQLEAEPTSLDSGALKEKQHDGHQEGGVEVTPNTHHESSRISSPEVVTSVPKGNRHNQGVSAKMQRDSYAGLFIVAVIILAVIVGSVALWMQREALFAGFGGGSDNLASLQGLRDVENNPNGQSTGGLASRTGNSVNKVHTTRITPDAPNGVPNDKNEGKINQSSASTLKEQASSVPIVAQSAILYEEGDDSNAQGFSTKGEILWSLDHSAADPVIVGQVELSGRGLGLILRILKNRDSALPASHLIEFSFQWPNDFYGKSIRSIAGVILKKNEQVKGDPLIGATAKVREGLYWLALSSVEADKARNIELLKDRNWFDIPILYETNRRAMISFEKGNPGQQLFEKALAAWGD